MGRGSSKAGGGSAYKQAVSWIKKNGIPAVIYNNGEETFKAIYRAISKYGKLTKEERTIYDNIKYDKEEEALWRSGHSQSIKGYTKEEIDGLKKFWAHSARVNRR